MFYLKIYFVVGILLCQVVFEFIAHFTPFGLCFVIGDLLGRRVFSLRGFLGLRIIVFEEYFL